MHSGPHDYGEEQSGQPLRQQGFLGQKTQITTAPANSCKHSNGVHIIQAAGHSAAHYYHLLCLVWQTKLGWEQKGPTDKDVLQAPSCHPTSSVKLWMHRTSATVN